MSELGDHVDIARILEQLKEDRDRIEQAIRSLESMGNSSPERRKGRKSGRHMSAEARALIGAAMKKRWAQRKRQEKQQPRTSNK